MKKQIYDEKNGLSYTLHGDYYLPDLEINEEEPTYGKYGIMRKKFLKEHRSARYQYLVLTGKLTEHLNQVDKEAREKAMELMKRTGLEDQLKKKAGKYSRGMRQRLGLADVLIKNPEIIILDEPTSGIDPAGVQEFIELIRWLSKEKGLTVLFSSHHLDQVQKVCDRVGLFSNGKILALIDMTELKDKKQELSDIYNHYFEEGGEQHE